MMELSFTFKDIGPNAEVVHLGELFRYYNNPRWYISLLCYPIQSKRAIAFSNVSVLSRGKYLNSTYTRSYDVDRVISLGSDYQLHPVKLGEFPDLNPFSSVREREAEQHGFLLDVPSDGPIIMPQLELARFLFFTSSYLCRACMSSTKLSLEFDVQYLSALNQVNIVVMPHCSFPKSAFDEAGTAKLLAWLLTEPSALRSYQSIYQHYQAERVQLRDKETWRFSFDPPRMCNWTFHLKGRYSQSGSIYLVDEIIGAVLDVEMPRVVQFVNPEFLKAEDKNGGQIRSGSGNSRWTNNEQPVEVDDQKTASGNGDIKRFNSETSWLIFKRPFEVIKKERVKSGSKSIADENSTEGGGNGVSTDDPVEGGSLPCVDLGGKEDITDRERQFASRFVSFDNMLRMLKSKYQCEQVNQETLALPKVGRSKQHLLIDGRVRVIRTVTLAYRARVVILLEVDTSDGSKMLSTKAIIPADDKLWIEQFIKIRRGIVSKSIAWPNDLFDSYFTSVGHFGINHPKHQGADAGNIPLESIETWADRVFKACW